MKNQRATYWLVFAKSFWTASICLLAINSTHAGIVVFEANSGSPAGIAATRSAFIAQGNLLAPAGQGIQDLNWDGLPIGSSVAGNAFNSLGIQFSTPGTGFLVDDDFGFPGDLQTFSPGNLFAQLNSNIIDFTFVTPGTNTATSTHAFSAIFVDLEDANLTTVEFFNQANTSIFTHSVLNGPNESLTFFGGVANAGEQISRVRITFPNNFVTSNGFRANEVSDFVVLDNVAFGSVSAVPEPSSIWLMSFAVLGLLGYRRGRLPSLYSKVQERP